MVLIPLLLATAGGIVFFSAGGLNKIRAFAESAPTVTDKQKGSLVVPTLETGKGTVGVSSGSRRTVTDIEKKPILRVPVATKRKFSPSADLTPIKTFFDNPMVAEKMAESGITSAPTFTYLVKQ